MLLFCIQRKVSCIDTETADVQLGQVLEETKTTKLIQKYFIFS